MPVINRIALFGFGRTGRIVSHALVNSCEKQTNNDIDLNQLSKVLFNDKSVSLVDIYKNVKHRYYPDKDYYNILQK